MDRRQFLGTSLLSAMAGAYAAGAEVAKDPHIQWLEEWKRTRLAIENAPDDTPEEDAAWQKYDELSRKLATEPTTTLEGLAAQLEYIEADLSEYIRNSVSDPFNNAIAIARDAAKALV